MAYTKFAETKSIISAKALKPAHFEMAQKCIAFNGGDPIMSLKTLCAAHMAIAERKYAPQYLSKNSVCKMKNKPGWYDLSRVKLAATKAVKAIAAPASTEVATVETPATPAKAKRESKPKRESKAKRGQVVDAITLPSPNSFNEETTEVPPSLE